jgi:hypothetical protein
LNTIKSQRSVVDSIIILPIVFWTMAYPYGQLFFAVSHCSAVKQVWLSGFDLPRQKVDKGQLISKAIYGLLTSPQKRTDKCVLFAFLLFPANKSNSSARQSAF